MVVLIHEVEAHLHPQWMRQIVPALLQINGFLDSKLQIQFVITSHSPLVLASLEPDFDNTQDKLFHLDLNSEEPQNGIFLKEIPFTPYGQVDHCQLRITVRNRDEKIPKQFF